MKKIREFNKEKVVVYVLAFFIIFWNIASILGIIAFFKTNKSSDNNIVASASVSSSNLVAPNKLSRTSLSFLDGAILPVLFSDARSEEMQVGNYLRLSNLAGSVWQINGDSFTNILPGYGVYRIAFVLQNEAGTSVSDTLLRIGYKYVSTGLYEEKNGNVYGAGSRGIVIDGVSPYSTISISSASVSNYPDLTNPVLISWFLDNFTYVRGGSYYQAEPSYITTLSSFGYELISPSRIRMVDLFTESSITMEAEYAFFSQLQCKGSISNSCYLVPMDYLMNFRFVSSTLTTIQDVFCLGYTLSLVHIDSSLRTNYSFRSTFHYYKYDENNAFVTAGDVVIDSVFQVNDIYQFIFPYIKYYNNIPLSLVPNVGDSYSIGTYSLYDYNNAAYYQSVDEAVQYWKDQYNALLGNYSRAYAEGENAGYKNGYNIGFDLGKSLGYSEGLANHEYSFNGLLSAVIDVPINSFTSLFNFELLGVNLANFFLSLLTVCIIITIVRLLL